MSEVRIMIANVVSGLLVIAFVIAFTVLDIIKDDVARQFL